MVWLEGDHDIATRDVFAATLAQAIALDEPVVVIDLSEVHFISAATIGVIASGQKILEQEGRSLVLRAPPPFVRRVFDVCGLSGLFEREASTDARRGPTGAAALGSWVEVPATERVDWHDTSVTVPVVGEQVSTEPAHESAHAEHAVRPLVGRIPGSAGAPVGKKATDRGDR